MSTQWPHTLGILGGLGPHAHIELERRLLKAAAPLVSEQDYPPWVLASIPSTPDRTTALLDGGPSPVPSIARGLESLAAADFAVIACITAHAFLGELRPISPLPILSLVEATLEEVTLSYGDASHVGILATTGTLRGGIFPAAAQRLAPGLRFTSPLDLPDGEQLQENEVMAPIYGPLRQGRRMGGGIKSGAERHAETGIPFAETLARAAARLTDHGADVVLTACTEIGMVLASDSSGTGTSKTGTSKTGSLLDPLDAGARAALAVSRGERPLP